MGREMSREKEKGALRYPLYRAVQSGLPHDLEKRKKKKKKHKNFPGILEKTKKKQPILLFHKNMLKYSSIFQKGEPL